MKKLCGVVCVLAMSLCLAGPAGAQTQITTGVIQGTVVDPSGAVVPGADVEVKNLDTNFVRTLVTNADGRFVALLLPPGPYTVKVTRQGFATVLQENLNLTVGQVISLSLTMKVGTVAETITVTDTPTVETVKTESSSTLNQTTVGNTPILGRKFEDLLTLTPGVGIVQGPDGDEINFAGQRGMFNNISLDGGDYNNGFFGEQVGGQRAAIDITLDAVKEFQVIANSGSAEFGRTAGGIVNVITKSGTNEIHGSAFHFQRLEELSANTSDGKPLKNFRREQFGGTIGGPFKKDKAFGFFAIEQIIERLDRENLSVPIGTTACSTMTPTVPANQAEINTNPECQRLALINFYQTTLNQREGDPVSHTIRNTSLLGKTDFNVTSANLLTVSFSFDRSRNENQTFDVPTYGNSANGIEGPSKIYSFNVNLFSTISSALVNEGHFTYLRELRPRNVITSNVPPDTGAGFVPSFRFGHPFFLQPNVDETFWRTQIRDNVSWILGKHTVKFGGEWMHSLNSQTFRGFFTGRYLFDSVVGFLRYASPAAMGAGFGPTTAGCANGTFTATTMLTRTDGPDNIVGNTDDRTLCSLGPDMTADTADDIFFTGGPLLFYLQDGISSGIANVPPPGASEIDNEDFAFFIQDKWQVLPNFTLNVGLRWEAQFLADIITPPSQTAYGIFLNNPSFPSDGTLQDQLKMFQPRIGFAWDVRNNRKSVLRAHWGIYNARQNMLSQVGSITTNGAQQRTNFVNTTLIAPFPIGFGVPAPVYPNVEPGSLFPCAAPANPPFPCFTGVRVFSRDYANPRVYTFNVAYEQEIFRDTSIYFDFTHSKGVHLTRFVNVGVGAAPAICCASSNIAPQTLTPGVGDSAFYSGPGPFGIALGDVFTASSNAKALYRGFSVGMRKRFSNRYQLEWNYTYSKDLDDDSSERDPFVDRTFNRFDLSLDYANSDRDQRHKFNFFTYAELPYGFQGNIRIQARSAQPITVNVLGTGTGAPCGIDNSRTRVVNGMDCGRNHLRKNNEFFSFDWRLSRPFKFGERYALIPTIEVFNSFNVANSINPVIGAALFNFDGFLRQGVGDPLQVQFAVKFTF